MKEYREEAKRHHAAKLEKYGASHEQKRAHGGHVHKVTCETGPEIKRAHGGKAAHEGHPHRERDLKLIEELEHDHEKKHGGAARHHRAMGGPIPTGAGSSRLGRGRKGKGKTQVNIAIGKPGGPDGGPTPPLPIGPGPGPAVPSAPPPRPILPAGAAPTGLPPRPMPPAGPMKHGGHVKHEMHAGSRKAFPTVTKVHNEEHRLLEEHEGKHHKHGGHVKHHQRHHSGHRGH